MYQLGVGGFYVNVEDVKRKPRAFGIVKLGPHFGGGRLEFSLVGLETFDALQ
jgi:hypothetical protein